MSRTGWTEATSWHAQRNDASMVVRPSPNGGFQWSVNRYPDIHKTGTADTIAAAQEAAVDAAYRP